MALVQKLNMIMTIISLIGLTGLLSVAKSEPNTNVNLLWCNENGYAEEDPYADSVAYVLADLMNVTPSRQGFDYSTVSPYGTAVSYGHATCNTGLSNNDCANCLVAAKASVSSSCLNSVGGRVAMVDCAMRYENYPF
ncbi:antifungal protein ginkbilobin-2 [Sesamum indicum]|uniref:Antifungal protein ginkbilobin-2 n=1 Tax=Sesamum indicum TaxID=4182 RepID=A0A6I9TCM8_SESIN|nr:antifungal protein ginkbilobin-2 [Sesamum indicum]